MVAFGFYWQAPTSLWIAANLVCAKGCLSTDRYQIMKMGNFTYQQLITPIAVSQYDDRLYLGLRLENQMEVLLISDPQANQATAAMEVGVGTKSEPKSLPGLAHILEHLLFMGNEKYPEEDEYLKYLRSRSGYRNAQTNYEDTLYNFSINEDSLEGGLDRFSQLFISPLLRQDSVEREARAVDSEHTKNLLSDSWRIDQVKRNVSNPLDPFSQFGTGTYDSLITIPKSNGIDTRQALVNFYNQFYTAKKMKLVVIGRESLSELKEMTISRFSKVPNRDAQLAPAPGNPFTKEHLGIQINIVPVKDISALQMEFLLPSQNSYYNEKPTYYISYFLGHEGTGTLTSHFKKLGWINNNSAGLIEDTMEFSILYINFELTSKGLEYTDDIISVVLFYIEMIKEDGVTKERFDEIQNLQSQKFRFIERSPSVQYAASLASAMGSLAPLSQVIISHNMINIFNQTLIKETLSLLNPSNMRVTLISPLVAHKPNLKIEPYYGTRFNFNKISKENLKKWSMIKYERYLHLPESNPFIAKDFSMIKSPLKTKFPELIYNSTNQVLWYTTGGVAFPKVSLNLIIKNKQWFGSAGKSVLLTLLINIIQENINSLGYMANLAGLHYSIEAQNPGIVIKVIGFTEKASELMLTIVKHLRHTSITPELFHLVKERLINNMINFNKSPAKDIVQFYAKLALHKNTRTRDQYLSSIFDLKFQDLMQFQISNITDGLYEMLVVGNLDQSRSKSLMNSIHSQLKLQKISLELLQPEQSVILADGHYYVHQLTLPNYNETDSAIAIYYDMYAYPDYKQLAIVDLIVQMLEGPFFDQLRTKEQLGYSVSINHMQVNSRGGIFILIQSNYNPIHLESRIDHFLNLFINQTNYMTDEYFDIHLKSLMSTQPNNHRDLISLASFYWNSILSGYYDFHQDETLACHLANVTKADVIDTIQTLLSSNPKRRILSIHGISAQTELDSQLKLSEYQEVICDLIEWRERQAIAPAPYPLE